MCGIAGFVGEGSKPILEKMTRKIAYRGPDGEGYFLSVLDGAGSFARYAALGHRRLSIIDLATGAQPIFNEDKSVAVVFNGEIYNYKAIRKKLEERHHFVTNSDTEVIAHLYEEKGEGFVRELEGMFAIALWDEKRGKLILARDRFGEKPLYYAATPNVFLFASELKAIMMHPHFERELDESVLSDYFLYECIPAPKTIYKHASKLEAAHYLVFQNGKAETKEYWNLAQEADLYRVRHASLGGRNLLDALDKKLDAAVSKMLMSDVPLGVFLSGGLDSSTVAYFAQKNSSQKINTFSIGFSEASFDESAYAEYVARRLGTSHHTRVVASRELLDAIPKIYQLLDEPMADPSLIPTYLLAQFARAEVTVALGGDGSDELFMGYPTFQAEKLAALYGRFPLWARRFVRPLVNSLPTSLSYMSVDFRLKRFVNNFDQNAEIRNQRWISAYTPEEARALLCHPRAGDPYEDIARHEENLSALDVQHRLSYLYTKHFLQDYVIAKVDRASMFNSLEVRAPFLDPGVAEFAFSLPVREKVRGLSTKHILKKLMVPRLGRKIAYRKKQGFQPPISKWLREGLSDLVDAYLSPSRIRAEGIFHEREVSRIVNEHRKGTHDHRKKLWTLLVFEIWKENYLK